MFRGLGFGANGFVLQIVFDPTDNHLGRGPHQFDHENSPPGSGAADLEDERSPHLFLLAILILTMDGHRNVHCRKASLFVKDRSQGPP